jgi:hypothetical protein
MKILVVQSPGIPLQEIEVDEAFEGTGAEAGRLIATKDGQMVADWNLADIDGWEIKDKQDQK